MIIGPSFKKDEHWFGGLRFFLNCHYADFGPPVQAPYKECYDMAISLPNRVMPSNTVLIVTADCTYTIDIRFKTIDPKCVKSSSDGNPSAIPSLGSVLEPIKIFVPGDGIPFPIIAQAYLGDHSGVEVDFRPDDLKLTDAKIAGKNIIWTFEAMKGFLGRPTIVNVVSTIVPEQGGPLYSKIQGYLVEAMIPEGREAK